MQKALKVNNKTESNLKTFNLTLLVNGELLNIYTFQNNVNLKKCLSEDNEFSI